MKKNTLFTLIIAQKFSIFVLDDTNRHINTYYTMAWNFKNLSKPVKDLIRDKQAEFGKAKDRKVSIEQTVEMLLKEAYLIKEGKEKV